MARAEAYTDLEGREIPLDGLDREERKLVAVLKRRARTRRDWNDFDNSWIQAVDEFYRARGLTRAQIRRTAVFQIAQDLSGRIAVAAGLARPPDYRDELEELVRSRFNTRREFCEATGLSEDMLSHVLARRKHVAIDTLSEALGRIGYTLRIAPKAGSGKGGNGKRVAG